MSGEIFEVTVQFQWFLKQQIIYWRYTSPDVRFQVETWIIPFPQQMLLDLLY